MPSSLLDGPTPLFGLSLVFAVVGASHLRLHWRGRDDVRFGLLAMASAIATLSCLHSSSPLVRAIPFGLAVAVLFGSHVLSRRTRQAYDELVALRAELEARVASRTSALEERSRELREASDAKSRFLASISHEIRTPLNGILGVNRMLLKSLSEGADRELAEVVQSQGRSLLAIINDILDYSKIEAGRFVLEPTDFSLRRTIQDAARVYREQARGKRLELLLDVDPALPVRVHGDGIRLRQILDNLLANAVKFTERGSVTFAAKREGESVAFEVRDTGIGLDPAVLPTLFQPFTQADASTTRRYGGTGLGLAISKNLVEMMGGTITASGEPGRGASFRIVVPLPPAEQPAGPLTPLEIRTPLYGTPALPPGGHALLAEDNAINRMVMLGLLRELGWTADVAVNGTEAVDTFRTRTFDLVLMDCRMPELDGYGAAALMRDHEGGRRRTPILAMTAQAVEGEAERCRTAGMDDYLTKPVSPAVLASALRRWRTGPTVDAAPAVDPATLDDLGRRSPTLLRQVLEHYLASIPGEMAEMRAEVQRGELERLSARAHDLAGSALLVGARELARLLRLLEAFDAAVHSGVNEALAQVEDEHRRVLEVLGTRLGSLPPGR